MHVSLRTPPDVTRSDSQSQLSVKQGYYMLGSQENCAGGSAAASKGAAALSEAGIPPGA